MPRIEDYALIGDLQNAALVSREGRSTGVVFLVLIRALVSRRLLAPLTMGVGFLPRLAGARAQRGAIGLTR